MISLEESQIYSEVEKVNEQTGETKTVRASWSGTITFDIPSLNWKQDLLHVSMGKAQGNQDKLNIIHKSMETGFYYEDGIPLLYTEDGSPDTPPILELCVEVEAKETEHYYRYQAEQVINEEGKIEWKRTDMTPIGYDEEKEKVRYITPNSEWLVTAKHEKAYFDSRLLPNKWIEIPNSFIIDVQVNVNEKGEREEEIVSPFLRTKDLIYTEDKIVPLSRVAEYKFKEIYMIRASQDKKIRENPNRLLDKAREMMEKQIACVEFFSWGKIAGGGGYTFYTAVLFPYERKQDGKLWLLQGMSEGILTLDEAWALEKSLIPMEVSPVPQARKPKVKLAK